LGSDGRLVKCAKCGHKWREYPPEDTPKQITETVALAAAAPPAGVAEEGGLSIEEMSRQARSSSPTGAAPGKSRVNWAGWGLLLVIVGGVVAGGYYGRDHIVQFVPATAKMYQALQLDVATANMLGLEIRDLQTTSVMEDGVVRLTVTGKVVNVTGSERPVPRVAIQLMDSQGNHVYSWSARIDRQMVEPWGSVEFSSSMNQPPDEAKHVKADLVAPRKPEQGATQ
jgi:hypothetical protein